MSAVRVVLCDVDFTLIRPIRLFDAAGYVELGAQLGATLDAERFTSAREAAIESVFGARSTLEHDGAEHMRFPAEIARGMGASDAQADRIGVLADAAWSEPSNFELYDDAAPALEALDRAGLPIGLISNTHRHLPEFIAAFELPVAFALSSREHGRVKPCPTIFEAALERAGAAPDEAVMVGDSLAHDIEGARACGIRAILVDRHDYHRDVPVEKVASLRDVPALLGVPGRIR